MNIYVCTGRVERELSIKRYVHPPELLLDKAMVIFIHIKGKIIRKKQNRKKREKKETLGSLFILYPQKRGVYSSTTISDWETLFFIVFEHQQMHELIAVLGEIIFIDSKISNNFTRSSNLPRHFIRVFISCTFTLPYNDSSAKKVTHLNTASIKTSRKKE